VGATHSAPKKKTGLSEPTLTVTFTAHLIDQPCRWSGTPCLDLSLQSLVLVHVVVQTSLDGILTGNYTIDNNNKNVRSYWLAQYGRAFVSVWDTSVRLA